MKKRKANFLTLTQLIFGLGIFLLIGCKKTCDPSCCNDCFTPSDISNEIVCQFNQPDRPASYGITITYSDEDTVDVSQDERQSYIIVRDTNIIVRIDSFGRHYDARSAVIFGAPDSISKILNNHGIEYDQCPCEDSLFFVQAFYDSLMNIGGLNPEGIPGHHTGGGGAMKTFIANEPYLDCNSYISHNYQSPGDNILIAILDAGIDSNDVNLVSYFNNLPLNLRSFSDIVGNDDLPMSTSNNHGSRVAMVIDEGLKRLKNNQSIILPIRTHFDHGYTTIYHVLCGMFTARQKAMGNDCNQSQKSTEYIMPLILNCSFSFYSCADSLYNAFPTYKYIVNRFLNEGVEIISSLGNHRLDLSVTNAYPSQFPGVKGVASIRCNHESLLSDFSNYSTQDTFYAAVGENPFAMDCRLRGTSFAAPQITAKVASGQSNYALSSVMHFICNSNLPNTGMCKIKH